MKNLGGFLIFVVFLAPAFAGEPEPRNVTFDWQHSFAAKQREGTFGSGVFFSPFINTRGRPVVNYAGLSGQLGYMLNDLNGSSWWRGNFEVLGEVFGSGIFQGRGNYLADTRFWLRYNFVQARWKVVPYFQVGAGVTFTDADQSAFGQVFNFNEAAAMGIRYFIEPRCSLNGEYRVQHVSNASMSDRNVGLNSQGPILSVSWFF